MSYSAFYSSAVSSRRQLRVLDKACLVANGWGSQDASAEATLICQSGGSGVTHEQLGAGVKGEEPTTNREQTYRGHLRSLSSPLEF